MKDAKYVVVAPIFPGRQPSVVGTCKNLTEARAVCKMLFRYGTVPGRGLGVCVELADRSKVVERH
jgi:hypothetical protein